MFVDGRHQSVKTVCTAAGTAEEIGIGLHLHDTLGGPRRSVPSLPRRIGGKIRRQRHQRPGGLLARLNIKLCLRKEIRDRVIPPANSEGCVDRNAVAATLRQIAQPLIGMALPGGAAMIDHRDHSRLARPQGPAIERAAAE